MTGEEFEKHRMYVRPETMHEGAVEAVTEASTILLKILQGGRRSRLGGVR